MKSLFLIVTLIAFSQTFAVPFQNLDFEEANTNTTQFFTSSTEPFLRGSGPIADLLPGWQIYHGTTQLTSTGYNYGQLANGWDTIVTDSEAPIYLGRYTSIDGKYAPVFVPDDQPFYLLQRGDIPV